MRKGNYEVSEKYLDTVLEIRKTALNTEFHQDIATILNNLAVLKERTGYHGDAIKLYENAIDIIIELK